MTNPIIPREAQQGHSAFSGPAHCDLCDALLSEYDCGIGPDNKGDYCAACLPEAWANTPEMQLAELAEYQRQALNLAGLADRLQESASFARAKSFFAHQAAGLRLAAATADRVSQDVLNKEVAAE